MQLRKVARHQPTVTRINRGKAKDVSEKTAIRVSVATVDYGVDTCNHDSYRLLLG